MKSNKRGAVTALFFDATSRGIAQKVTDACLFLPLLSFNLAQRASAKRVYSSGFILVVLSFTGVAEGWGDPYGGCNSVG